MTTVHGRCDDRFSGVRDAFAANFDKGLDVGASAAVTVDGELVVDLWGGSLDAEGTAPWAEDTIVNVYSTTKTMTALSALLLADRGELDLHAPVVRYWPEFKAGGKEAVEVRHLLGHTAGLAAWREPMTGEDLYDWEKCTSLLAAQEPWWEPGTASGYHAVTQGYLVGEVVRRASGATSLGTFFRDELAEPLGADFHIGTPASCDHRVGALIPPAALGDQLSEAFGQLPPDHVAIATFTNPMVDASASFSIPWRRAEIPAAGGHGNARSVAQIQSIVACGGEVGGQRFLSEDGCRAIFEVQADGTDLVLFAPLLLGTGYGLANDLFPFGSSSTTCFWGGWGGSLVVIDTERRLCVTYVMNKMGAGTLGDDRGLNVVIAAFDAAAR